MVSSIIHHQNHSFRRVALHQQFFQETDEGGAVFGLGGRPGDGIFQPVIATKDMPLLLCPGRVAGIRFCCPFFIQQARSGGSRVTVVSSTKMSSKSSPRTFFSTPPTNQPLSLWLLCPANGPNHTLAADIDILCASTTPEIGFHSD